MKMFFIEPDAIIAWLDAGAPLPGPARVTHFGSGERPVRKPQFEIDNHERYTEYLRRGGHNATLFGRGFFVDARAGFGDVQFYSNVRPGSGARSSCRHEWLAAAHDIFVQFESGALEYGCACEHDEWSHYNIAKLPSASNPTRIKMSAPVGRDYTRYVPGIYWMNYFSQPYMDERGISIEALVAALGGEVTGTENGVIWRLFPDSRDWRTHAARIAAYTAADDAFFSLSRLSPIPPGLTPREELDFTVEHWKPWSGWPARGHGSGGPGSGEEQS